MKKTLLFLLLSLVLTMPGFVYSAELTLDQSVDDSLDPTKTNSVKDWRLTAFANWAKQATMNGELYGKVIASAACSGDDLVVTFTDTTTVTATGACTVPDISGKLDATALDDTTNATDEDADEKIWSVAKNAAVYQPSLGTIGTAGLYPIEEGIAGVTGKGVLGNWKMLYTNAAGGNFEEFDIGNAGYGLVSQGTAGAPFWAVRPQTITCTGTDKVSSFDITTGLFACTADEEGVGGSDSAAIHDNVANEISALTEKATPVSGDLLIIEDSETGFIKKKLPVGNLPSGDMTLDTAQSVTGAKTFDPSTLQIKGSSTGKTSFTSANDGATNYTLNFPAADGNIARISDIPSVLQTVRSTANSGSTTAVPSEAVVGDALAGKANDSEVVKTASAVTVSEDVDDMLRAANNAAILSSIGAQAALTLGTGVETALGNAPNATGGFITAQTGPVAMIGNAGGSSQVSIPNGSVNLVLGTMASQAGAETLTNKTLGQGSVIPVTLTIAASDEDTAITAAAGKVTFRAPWAFTLTGVRASCKTAPTGANLVIDVNETGTTSVLATKITIEAGEYSSVDATTQPVIGDSGIADNADMSIDFDTVGSSVAGSGVKVILYGTRVLP